VSLEFEINVLILRYLVAMFQLQRSHVLHSDASHIQRLYCISPNEMEIWSQKMNGSISGRRLSYSL